MQITHDFEAASVQAVTWGVRILALVRSPDAPLVTRIAKLAGPVEVETEFYAGLSAVIDDPSGYGLFVMDCDAMGGIEGGRRAVATLRAVTSRIPVVLISSEHENQVFPQDRESPVLLRAPLSALSLRIGFEHALRDRLAWRAA